MQYNKTLEGYCSYSAHKSSEKGNKMPKKCDDMLVLANPPRWNQHGGEWYVEQTPPRNGVSKMYRHKPSIHLLCEPLMGTTIRNRKSGLIVGVRYQSLVRRCEIYRECIEVLIVFKSHECHRTDLFTLATYRRQVTKVCGIPMDALFFHAACTTFPALTWEEWRSLAQRMPDRAEIKRQCMDKARDYLKAGTMVPE